jgi:hypothetical protein
MRMRAKLNEARMTPSSSPPGDDAFMAAISLSTPRARPKRFRAAATEVPS